MNEHPHTERSAVRRPRRGRPLRVAAGLGASAAVAAVAVAGAWWVHAVDRDGVARADRERATRAAVLIRREVDRARAGAAAAAASMGEAGVERSSPVPAGTALQAVAFVPGPPPGGPSAARAIAARPPAPPGPPPPPPVVLAGAGPVADALRGSAAGSLAAEAWAAGRARLGPPGARGADGAVVVLVAAPVRGRGGGAVLGALDLRAVAAALGPPALAPRVRVQLTEDGRPLLSARPPEPGAQGHTFTVAGRTWTAWARGPDAAGVGVPLGVAGLGLGLAAVLGLVVVGAGRSEREARRDAQRRAEELELTQRRLAAMAAAAQDGLSVIDADGRIVEVNERHLAITGRSREEVIGVVPPYPWWPPEDAERILRIVKEGAEGTGAQVGFSLLRPDGTRRDVELVFVPAGTDGGWVATIRDLTAHRRAEGTEAGLRQVATLIARGAPSDDVFQAVAAATQQVFGAAAGVVMRFGHGGVGEIMGWSGAGPEALRRPGTRVSLAGSDGTATGRVMRSGRSQRAGGYDRTRDPVGQEFAGITEETVAVPVHVDGRLWGALAILTAPGTPAPPDAEARLERFADLVAVALAEAEAHAELEEQATTDHLTHLANHRALYERLKAEVAAARRTREPLCLAVVDIDGFKAVNDLHGHIAGDHMLGALGAVLGGLARGEPDLVARVGGDEFAWLMPATSLEEAVQALERARSAVAQRRFPPAGRLSISAGVASLEQAGGDARELARLVDGALYWAKAEGRNRVVAYDPERVTEHSPEERAERIRREQGLAALRALARAVDAKDPDTLEHSERVAALAVMLARSMGWTAEDAGRLRQAALVHDVGKIGVPDAVLFKPAALSPPEMDQVRAHAALGAEIANEVLDPEQAAWVRAHHERYDGGGYPDGLAGQEIAQGGRILSVADAFDVMVSVRTYKRARSYEDALAECEHQAGRQFDPEVVRALWRLWTAGVLVAPAAPPQAPRGG